MDLILIFGSLLIVFLASQILNFTYAKYKKIEVYSNMTGYDVAKAILTNNGLDNIKIGKISGNLSDHYSNGKKQINLSTDIYENATIASVAVAAHECGHAIQYKEGYKPVKIKNMILPFSRIGTNIGYVIIGISLFSTMTKLFTIGIILVLIGLLFQVFTLPVEFDASRRANTILLELGIISEDEQMGTKKMLKAAAFTYVASLLSSLMQILRYILIFTGNKNRD